MSPSSWAWPSAWRPPDKQNRLLAEFRRYTVASYVATFKTSDGQRSNVSPDTRGLDAERVVVQTRIFPAPGEATRIDYVMQPMSSGWKAVDVLSAVDQPCSGATL